MATDPKNAHLITRVGGGQGSVSVEWHHEEDTALSIPFAVVAVPDTGWRFSHWMMKSQSASDYYRTVGNPYAYYLSPTSYYSEIVFEAYFEIDPNYQPTGDHTITVLSNPQGGGAVTGGGTYASGATCTISATAASGYHFVKWVCSNGREITDASYTFAVSASLTFTAQFAEGTGMPLYETSGQIIFGSNGEILFDG